MRYLRSVVLMRVLILYCFCCIVSFRLLIAAATDERIQATNELIASMRIVKMYSWEKSFQELIDGLRK